MPEPCCPASACAHDPQQYAGQPMGMYHCPDCGEMQIAGLPHSSHALDCQTFWNCPEIGVFGRSIREGCIMMSEFDLLPKHFRKKPIVVEAMQFFDTPKGLAAALAFAEAVVLGTPEYGFYLSIKTLEGYRACQPGDWIIRGIRGEFRPCKPDIFEATYEQV